VTDVFTSGSDLLTSKYQDAKTTKGDFTTKDGNGVWTIRTMQPGESAILTYSATLDADKYFAAADASVTNAATAAYNDTTMDPVPNTLKIENGTLTISKSGPTTETVDGKTCLQYTLTVNAYGANVDNVVVKDSFKKPQDIETYQSFEKSQGDDPEVKTVTTSDGKTGKTMEWNVGTVEVGKPATLTYTAVVSSSAWDDDSSTGYPQNVMNQGLLKLSLTNTAGVYVRPDANDTSKDRKYDEASKELKDYSKTLIKKDGTKNNDNGYDYKITINNPDDGGMNGDVSYIKDDLTGGKYSSDVTVAVYDANSSLLGKFVVSGIQGNTNWELNLKELAISSYSDVDSSISINDHKVNIASTTDKPYWYEITYSATTVGYMTNDATVGYGIGANGGYAHTHKVTWGGTTTSFTYSKKS
jgi:hypothetical protein